MLSIADYGNAAAYLFVSTNISTAYLNGTDSHPDGVIGWSRVAYYSIIRDSSVSPPFAATPNQRLTGGAGVGAAAVVGRQGLRPVAFPLTEGWNFDVPATT